ncbi:MAG: polysaccharide deacetylase family protein [Christensenellales bacterium]
MECSLKSKKNLLVTVVVNLILVLCVMSVFGVCFYTDSTVVVSSTGYKAIYRGNENNKNATLCINVYWGTEYLSDMLDILKGQNVKTTFFVGGMWASENVELLKRIVDDGHELGNHGYYHKDHKLVDYDRNVQEISYTHKLIKGLVGIDMTMFMPPSGSYGSHTLEAAENLGYTTIMWSKDTIDWRDKDTNLIYSRATKNMQNGDIVLMHPTECTKNALNDIITAYKSAGFNIVPISENIA